MITRSAMLFSGSVMAMDFSEERRISQAKDSDESDDSDWETASISDWDMRMISGMS